MTDRPCFTAHEILHEDSALLLIHKPAGILSHPNGPGESDDAAFLGSYDPANRSFTTPAGKLWLMHRLDEDTSGVLLAAKTSKAAEACLRAFEEDRVRKYYHALVRGTALKPAGAWLDHIATRGGSSRVRSHILKGARPNAELHYKLLQRSVEHRVSLLEIDLYTGKTHQIRVQAAARDSAVLGDDVYGDFQLNRELRKSIHLQRLCLHAHRLELMHPLTNKKLSVTASWPVELRDAAKALGLSVT